MQIYTDVLSELSLRGAARRLALNVTDLSPLPKPKLAATGWRIELTRPGGKPATWHDYGYFLAQLYEADPDMRARSAKPSMAFESAGDFEVQTDRQFALPEPGREIPEAAESWRSIGMEAVLPVAYGTVDVHFCGDGHIVAYAGRSDRGTITYAGSDWHVRVDLWEATGWSEKVPGWSEKVPPGYSDFENPCAPYGPCRAFPTRGAPREEVRDAIAAVVTTTIRAYVHDHPDVLLRADVLRLEHEIPEARRKAEEAYAIWTEVRDEAAGLADQLRAAQDKLAGLTC